MISAPRILIDTSAWVEFLRGRRSVLADLVDSLLERDAAVLCGMVELELLQGLTGKFKSRRQSELLRPLLGALPFVETHREDFIRAGRDLGKLRGSGFTVPANDGLIAAVCLREDLPLLTLDSHFDHWPQVKRIPVP